MLQLADRNVHSTRRFFHYLILFTLPSIAGGCRCAEATTTQKSRTRMCSGFFWRSRRDSNPRAVLAATRFPVVLVMTTSILLHILFYCRTCFAQALSCDSDMYYNRYSVFVKYFFEISFLFFFPPSPHHSAADIQAPATLPSGCPIDQDSTSNRQFASQ